MFGSSVMYISESRFRSKKVDGVSEVPHMWMEAWFNQTRTRWLYRCAAVGVWFSMSDDTQRPPPKTEQNLDKYYFHSAAMLTKPTCGSRKSLLALYSVACRDGCWVEQLPLLLQRLLESFARNRNRISQYSIGQLSDSNDFVGWCSKRIWNSGRWQTSIW